MTIPVSIQQRIRILDARGVSWREIARRLNVSRDTVRKYAVMEDCSPAPRARSSGRSGMDGYSSLVDSWLAADRRMPRKQRHTAKRVYDRLVEEAGFTGSYSMVQRYVKRWREDHRLPDDGFMELEWRPGTMQVDFGQALAVIGGAESTVHCLVASFPHSNMRYAAALPGENAECVCEGLLEIFEHIGMVPPLMVFDNATGAAAPGRVGQNPCGEGVSAVLRASPDRGQVLQPLQRMGEGKRGRRGRLPAPQSHGPRRPTPRATGSSPAICCPDATPSPTSTITGPAGRTGTCSPTTSRTCCHCPEPGSTPSNGLSAGRTGRVTSRSTPTATSRAPSWRGWTLQVGLRAFAVEIRTRDGRKVNTLPRVYGRCGRTVRNPACLLPALARKPRAWGESPIRGDFPGKLRLRIDAMDSGDRQRTLRLIARASDASGFKAATAAAEHLVEQGHGIDEASLMTLARRIAAGETPHEEPAPDLHDYDRFMRPADDRKEA